MVPAPPPKENIWEKRRTGQSQGSSSSQSDTRSVESTQSSTKQADAGSRADHTESRAPERRQSSEKMEKEVPLADH